MKKEIIKGLKNQERVNLNSPPKTHQKLVIVNFQWDDEIDSFVTPTISEEGMISKSEINNMRIISKEIEKHSGLKKPNIFLEIGVFLAIIVGGYTAAYFTIKSQKQA
jgi:hypothetical protein